MEILKNTEYCISSRKNTDCLGKCTDDNIKVINITDSDYPDSLRILDRTAPGKIYCRGDISVLGKRCAAVVGSRKASSYGKNNSYSFGKLLAENDIVTVSGMAYGCDSHAHRGAIDGGGKTIAVLGCGVDICYPSNNRKLMEDIMENGLVISEFPPGTPPIGKHFPMRNRIISALSELVIISEASLSSGSLITAGCAAEQGKMLMAAPGNITNIMSIGCNKLIQDGVTPIVTIDDIIKALGITDCKNPDEAKMNLGTDEKIVYSFIRENGEVTFDYIIAKLDMKPSVVNAIVSILEIKGLILTDMGKIYIAK